MSINLVVLGFASVDGFHVESMPEDEWDAFTCAEIGEPVPGEDTFYCDHKVFPVRSNSLEEGPGFGLEVSMKHDLPVMVQDSQTH